MVFTILGIKYFICIKSRRLLSFRIFASSSQLFIPLCFRSFFFSFYDLYFLLLLSVEISPPSTQFSVWQRTTYTAKTLSDGGTYCTTYRFDFDSASLSLRNLLVKGSYLVSIILMFLSILVQIEFGIMAVVNKSFPDSARFLNPLDRLRSRAMDWSTFIGAGIVTAILTIQDQDAQRFTEGISSVFGVFLIFVPPFINWLLCRSSFRRGSSLAG